MPPCYQNRSHAAASADKISACPKIIRHLLPRSVFILIMNMERSNSTLDPSPTQAPPSSREGPPLPNDVATLHAMIRELIDSLHQEQREREGVQQRLDLLLRKLYGPKAERFDPNQPWLLPELAPNAAGETAESPAVGTPNDDLPDGNGAPRKRKGGRKKLPENLPRIRIEHALGEAERLCPCCNEVCQKFGEEISEQLDYKPASLFVRQHVRFKYSCRKCHDHVTTAHVPIAIINKGLPGPGLLAHITACKYADHLPLHRLERILSRHGIELSRQTMCDWMAHVASMLHPIVDRMATCQPRFESGPKTCVGPVHRASGGPRDSAHLVK